MSTPRRRAPDLAPALHIVPGEPPETVDAWTILRTKYPPMPWTVPGILPRDFNMLSGAPKAGKSWVALWFALKVATSPAPAPDAPAPSVLYVTPDDTDRANIQERINILLGGVSFDPGRLDIWDRFVPRLDEGLLNKLAAYLVEHPQCVYIVLDVWNALKPNRTTDDVQKHEHTAMAQFRDFAQEHQIGLTLLNHDNKRPAGGRATRISGSNGLLGGVQSYMTLERDEDSDKVLLFRRGRRGRDTYYEFRLDDLGIEWTPDALNERPDTWTQEELAAEAAAAAAEREAEEARKRPHVPGPIEQRVLDALADGREWKPKDLAIATGVRHGTVKEYLRRMLGRSQVKILCYGVYRICDSWQESQESQQESQESQQESQPEMTPSAPGNTGVLEQESQESQPEMTPVPLPIVIPVTPVTAPVTAPDAREGAPTNDVAAILEYIGADTLVCPDCGDSQYIEEGYGPRCATCGAEMIGAATGNPGNMASNSPDLAREEPATETTDTAGPPVEEARSIEEGEEEGEAHSPPVKRVRRRI